MTARQYMEIALQEAEIAAQINDVPVGAIVVYKEEIIAKAHNRVVADKNPLAHAELLAIQEATKKMNATHLEDCSLYVTLEPCSMCAGAIVLARIKQVYFGANDWKTGAGGSVYNILQDKRLNHQCNVYGGFLEEECSKILSSFFYRIRK